MVAYQSWFILYGMRNAIIEAVLRFSPDTLCSYDESRDSKYCFIFLSDMTSYVHAFTMIALLSTQNGMFRS